MNSADDARLRGGRWFTLVGWLCAGGLAARTMHATNSPAALGAERVLGPLLVASLNLPLFALAALGALFLRRLGLPRVAGILYILAPLLVIGTVWAPALAQLPDREIPRSTGTPAGPPLVVLLTLESFRADHLNAQRDPSPKAKRGLTPKLDALAESGALLSQAVTSAPLTVPAHAGMLTGKSPTEHGLVRNGQAVAEADLPSVIAELSAAGWRTGAFVSSNILDRSTGLSRGFTHYDDRWSLLARLQWIPMVRSAAGPVLHQARRGDETVARALRWLGESSVPTVLWVHLYDPHAPYSPPDAWSPPDEELAAARAADDEAAKTKQENHASSDRTGSNPPARRVHTGRAMYRSELRWTDHVAGTLIDAVGPEAVILAVGAHGESLGEHGSLFMHGLQLYEPVLKVPFIVRWPGQIAPGTRFPSLTSNTQVADLLRQATGLLPFTGLHALDSVAAYTSGERAPPGWRAIRAARGGAGGQAAACVRLPGEKVLTEDGATFVHFDLAADPDELNPQPVPMDRITAEAEVRRMIGHRIPTAANAERERVEALGYTE